MRNILWVSIKAFAFSGLVSFVGLGTTFIILSGEVIRPVKYTFFGSILFASFFSLYGMFVLIMFKKRLLFYNNMEKQLSTCGAKNIIYESIAGNATYWRIKYGGLFLTNDSLIFIPHRFALKPLLVNLPLNRISEAGKLRMSLSKLYSGGLRKRLLIQTIDKDRYEFSVWELDSWIEKIISQKTHLSRGKKDEVSGRTNGT